jgi:hypothetical protein
MSKRSVSITVDEFVHDAAKKKNINISETCERALAKKINPADVKLDEKLIGDKCEYCSCELPKCSVISPNGLMWFLPDEKWICPKCMKTFTERIIKNEF